MSFTRLMVATIALVALITNPVSAQVAPGVFTTVKSTSTAATSMCVGCPTGTTTPAANSGLTARTLVLPVSGAPSDTTLKIYQVGGALFFNGLSLATGSSISGTTGAIPKFTAITTLGDSIMSESSGTITVAGLLSANGNLSSGTNGAEGNLIINGPAGSNRIVAWRTAGVNRWFAYATSVAESGANAGSNYRLDAYNDAGTLIGTVMLATRASLAVTLGGALTVTGASALSGGATAGVSFQLTGAAPVYLANVNNGYLFRNAADGATLFSITNAGVGTFVNALTASSTLGVTGNFAVNTTAFTVVAASGNTVAGGTFSSTGATRLGTGTTGTGWGVNAAGDFTFGATNISDSVGTPTVATAYSAVSGTDYAMKVQFTALSITGGTINFGHTWTTAPVCTGASDGVFGAGAGISTSASTTVLTISHANTAGATGIIYVLCRSF